MTDEHPNAEDYRNRAERPEHALAELAGHDGLSLDDRTLCEALEALERSSDYPFDYNTASAARLRIRALSGQLATERANADKLAEALGEAAPHLVGQEWEYAQEALAAHNLLRIDG